MQKAKTGTNARAAAGQEVAFRRVERGNAAEQVLDDLHGQILAGSLARGAKLPTEKQLADAYGVSGATVREAIRGLVATRLVEVRHGSGAYVTADAAQLIAISLNAMIQIEKVGLAEVLGVLGVLNTHAAELAARWGDAEDADRMQAALDVMASAVDAEHVALGLDEFLHQLAQASRNPLLAVLCRFLAGLQIAMAREIVKGSLAQWRETTSQLASARQKLVDAIRRHDVEAARSAARAWHERTIQVVTALPEARAARMSAQVLESLLSSFRQRMPV